MRVKRETKLCVKFLVNLKKYNKCHIYKIKTNAVTSANTHT